MEGGSSGLAMGGEKSPSPQQTCGGVHSGYGSGPNGRSAPHHTDLWRGAAQGGGTAGEKSPLAMADL